MPISVLPVAPRHVRGLRDCLDLVAREKQFLAMTQAPAPPEFERDIGEALRQGGIHLVALDGASVVGWIQVRRGQGEAVAHRGDLGMGIRPSHRGQGLGRRLLGSCIARAAAEGLACLELEVRVDNGRALALYRDFGFRFESTLRAAMVLEGVFYDAHRMSLALPPLTRPGAQAGG